MLTTYSYEVLVAEKDEDGEVTGLKLNLRGSNVYPEPTREDLLIKYAKEIGEAGVKASEVVTTINPFRR